jgi:hypothetical protein
MGTLASELPGIDQVEDSKRSGVRTKAVLALVIGFALLLVPVYWIALRAPAVGLYHDDAVYLTTAKALATGQGYRVISLPDEIPQTKYPILFPLTLATIWKLSPHFPDNTFLLKLVPFFFGLTWLALSYRLLRSEAVPRNVALVTLLLTAASPIVMYLHVTLLSETLFAMLCTATLLLLRKIEQGRAGLLSECGAGALAGLAILTRTAGLPLVLAGAVVLLWKRGWKSAARFTSVWAVLYLPWVIWVTTHHISRFTDAYYSAQNYGGWNIVFNFTWAQKCTIALGNIFVLWQAPLSVLGVITPIAIVGGALAVYGFARHCKRELGSIHLFLALYIALIICWAWIPTRFLAVVLPLVYFFMWQGVVDLLKARRVPRLVAALLLTLLIANSARIAYSFTMRTARNGIVWNQEENWRDLSALLAWVRNHTEKDAILVGNMDPMFYLYTGHKAVRGFYSDPYNLFYSPKHLNPLGSVSEFRESMVRQNASYLIVTPNEAFAERPYFKGLVSELNETWPGALRLLYQGRTSEYRVYRIDRQHLTTSLIK